MTVTVRAARADEYESVARVSVAAYEADGQLKGEHGYERVLADVAARAVAGEILVAVDERDTVLGTVLFVVPGSAYAELSRPGEAEFRMLAVDPAAQGRGVGEALVLACVARARELRCAALVICVRKGYAAGAHRLYARLGFVRVPELDWSPIAGVHLLGLRLKLA